MASHDSSTYVEWMWQSNLNPFSPFEEEEWCSYSEEECEIIEEAYIRRKRCVYLKNYQIDFERQLQISIKNPTKRRPIRRIVHDKESWIKCEGKLGEGHFGKVYKGTYRESQEVAYKVTKTKLSQAAQSETNILKTLHHPSIVQYIDVIHTSQHTLLVMELIDGGRLLDYIWNTPKSFVYWCDSRNMMVDVAYAMSYLHEKKVVHADLKSDNILLRKNGTAVLSDFGLSKMIEDSKTHYSNSSRGAIRWLAPELCFDRPERSSFPSDVWAFGCVLLEIMTKEIPWMQHYEDNQELMDALADERNGVIFQEICRKQRAPEKFRRILCACCTWSKRNRPNFEKIIKDFRSISNSDLDLPNERHPACKSSRTLHSGRQDDVRGRCQTAPTTHTRTREERFAHEALYSSEEDEDNFSSETIRNHACTSKSKSETMASRRSALRNQLPNNTHNLYHSCDTDY
ncbi:unnamed protein product [Rotaria sp. Silwood1]|nr:unnamed protein product [Rotaria sp. Silwood1]